MSAYAPAPPPLPNPLQTKSDLSKFLKTLLHPLTLPTHSSPGCALIHLGHTATHYDETAALLEGFSRPIWGLASLLAGLSNSSPTEEGSEEYARRWATGLENGTNPNGEEFWGDMRDKDQRMVECSAIGFALAVAKEKIWDKMSDEGKTNLENWLGGMNDKEMPNTNWLWFRVFANLGLQKVESKKYNGKRMKADLDHLDTFYIGDGWSRDGPEGVIQLDYYSSSFAIQFAQLVYSRLAQDEDPERCEEYRNRAKKFALDFVHYFDEEGRAIPFGRSMTYRFAMSSFWGAYAFAATTTNNLQPPHPLTWGQIKGLQLRNVRYWASQPGAYNPDGTLTIGYCYPNHNMTENYNSPGSPYWCCKSFITLSLDEDHPFWKADEEPLGIVESIKSLKHPLHIMVNRGGHSFLLSSGQQCSYAVKQSAAKYGKFAYSAAFGYSVPVGSLTLEEHGADSTLALSDDNGETWKVRRVTKEARIVWIDESKGEGKWLRSMWYPWEGVEVETWLVPPSQEGERWYVRVHRIRNRSGRKLISAEGGWALYGQGKDGRALANTGNEESEQFGAWENDGAARAVSKAGVSGVVDLRVGNSKGVSRNGKVIRMDANTNLMVARSVLPLLMGEHSPIGEDEWVAVGVFGLPAEGQDGAKGWLDGWKKRPALAQGLDEYLGN